MEYQNQVGRCPLASGGLELIALECINWKYQSNTAGAKFLMLKILEKNVEIFKYQEQTKAFSKHAHTCKITYKNQDFIWHSHGE